MNCCGLNQLLVISSVSIIKPNQLDRPQWCAEALNSKARKISETAKRNHRKIVQQLALAHAAQTMLCSGQLIFGGTQFRYN
jgi:hypothetical protein